MKTVAELLNDHVVLDIECIDRIYLNGYIPKLQTPQGLTRFLSRDYPVASPALLNQMTKNFVKELETFAGDNHIPIIQFEKKQRKDDIANRIRAQRNIHDGVVFIGVAQEKANAFKARKVGPYEFEYSRQSVFVKHYYIYVDDADFGPGFIKICTYAPYPIRVCLNGHEWVKRQLKQRLIGFESLDNGFLSCDQAETLQTICNHLTSNQINCFFDKWIERLPFPLSSEQRHCGYRHELSIWQLELSKTQVFSQPVRGREFFENVIRENIDLGRPDRVKLLFDRQIRKNTPGRFSTRVITSGVHPSIHIEYKSTHNRMLDPGYLMRDQSAAWSSSIQNRVSSIPRVRSPALKLGDPRVIALFASLTLFLHSADGFRNKDLRPVVADLTGLDPQQYTPRNMSYDLRRLRLKGIIYRQDGSTKYWLTTYGIRVAMFLTRVHAHVLRPGLYLLDAKEELHLPHRLAQAFNKVNQQIDNIFQKQYLHDAA